MASSFSKVFTKIALIIAFSYIGLFLFAWFIGRQLVFPMPDSSYSETGSGWVNIPYTLPAETNAGENSDGNANNSTETAVPEPAGTGSNAATDATARNSLGADTATQQNAASSGTSGSDSYVVARILEAKNPQGYILYQHGNGEDLGTITNRLETLNDLGWTVLAWDYPGYGLSPGKSNEAVVSTAMRAVATYAQDTLKWPVDETVIYGRSVGGGPSILLATEADYKGLILESTFTSPFRIVTYLKVLPFDVFDNWARIGSIRTPVLFLHGTRDEVVPFSHGPRLNASAPEPKQHRWIEGGKHNNLVEEFHKPYTEAVGRFLKNLPPEQPKAE